MIELSISIALVLIIATLSIPALLNHAAAHVQAETRLIKTTCWYLQQLARAKNEKFELKFDPAGNSYSFNNQLRKLSRQVKFNASAGAYGPPASGKPQQIAHPITFANNTIIFYPQGTQQAGSIYLSDQQGHAQYALTAAVAGVPYLRMYHLVNHHWRPCT